jgi:DNA-directed RNA polymerase specialized sigma24 family protein
MNPVDFGGIYERYAADVFRFALYLGGNRADAEEIASETFVRAWLATGEITPPFRFVTTAAVAAIAWTVYVVVLTQQRRLALRA